MLLNPFSEAAGVSHFEPYAQLKAILLRNCSWQKAVVNSEISKWWGFVNSSWVSTLPFKYLHDWCWSKHDLASEKERQLLKGDKWDQS